MKEKKPISVGKALIISLIITLVIVIGHVLMPVFTNFSVKKVIGTNSVTKVYNNTFIKAPRNVNNEYNMIIASILDDKSFIDGINPEKGIENSLVKSKDEFETIISKCAKRDILRENDLTKEYKPEEVLLYINNLPALEYFNDDFFKNHNLIIQMNGHIYGGYQSEIIGITTKENKAVINIKETSASYGEQLTPSINFEFIPVDKSIEYAEFNIYHRDYIGFGFMELIVFSIKIIVLWILVSIVTIAFSLVYNEMIKRNSKV